MQIAAGVIVIAMAAYFILPNLLSKKVETSNNALEQAMNNKTVYSFVKQGELTFSSDKGVFITGIDVEIADTPDKRETGLMFRDKMEQSQGMLFVFPNEEPQSFWMHNTVLPLDIIYVNSKMEIVKIAKSAKPYDDTSLPSVKPAQYVVEVNAGFSDKYNLKEGDKIVWRRE